MIINYYNKVEVRFAQIIIRHKASMIREIKR